MRTKVLGVSANVVILGAVSFITDLSSEMMKPLLPLFITGLGGGGLAIGLIGGLGDGFSSLLQVFSGYWSDRAPRRKPFVFAGYAVSSVFKLFLALSSAWQHVLVALSLERVGKGLRTAPRDAIIADSTEQSLRGRAFGLHRALDTGGAVAGSLAALLLFRFLGFELRSILVIAAVVAFAALFPLYWVRERPREPRKLPLALTLRRLPGRFRLFLLAATAFGLANFTYLFFILRARDFFIAGSSEREAMAAAIGLYIVYNVVYSLLALPMGALSDRFGRGRVLIVGYFLFAITCFGFALVDFWVLFLVLFGLYGVVYAIVETTQRAFACDLTPEQCQGAALGMLHTCTGIATICGSLIAGQLWEVVGAAAAFVYGGAVALLATALLLALIVRSGGHAIRQPHLSCGNSQGQAAG
ncbi:MAG: MFS transporter [Dehalococcoidia bacterium]